jgi:hypothetical protein
MQWKSSVLLVLAVVGFLLARHGGYAAELRRLDGQVSLSIDATVPSAGGFRDTWNKGTLTLTDGSKHLFAVSGLGVQGDEGSIVGLEARGEVYHLQKIEDFAGTYRRTTGELSPERATNTVIIQNQHGVVVVVTVAVDRAKSSIRLVPSESGVTVRLER